MWWCAGAKEAFEIPNIASKTVYEIFMSTVKFDFENGEVLPHGLSASDSISKNING
jgi:hypothetical protein